jgi:hypothetical protein
VPVVGRGGLKVEHAICELKCYKVMGTLWKHPRPKLKNLVKICAGFVNRRKPIILFNTLRHPKIC